MLATTNPRSLISNSKIDLEETLLRCNRNEFHHVFPKAFLQRTNEEELEKVLRGENNGYDGLEFLGRNWLVNFCFLSSADNQRIKDKAPSQYIDMIPADVRSDAFERAFLPPNWFRMNFEDFTSARSKLIEKHAKELCGL
jgi:hypothetical protein